MTYSNCIDCPHHEVIYDPDPHDSFCSDDKAVVCRLTLNPYPRPKSIYVVERHPCRSVTRSARPYKVREESSSPDWCPLKHQVEKAKEEPALPLDYQPDSPIQKAWDKTWGSCLCGRGEWCSFCDGSMKPVRDALKEAASATGLQLYMKRGNDLTKVEMS